MQMQKVLFGTDYSDASKWALGLASSLARDAGATLIICHVSDREPYPVGELFDEDATPDPAEMAELRTMVPGDPRLKYEYRLLYGEPGSAEPTKPADELVKFAKKEQVDLIVVGTHGRSGLRHLLTGSVAESVIREAPCPVVVVKQPSFSSNK